MQLASRLRQTTLGDLLAALHREGASGVLELIEPRGRHAIHLRRGMVHAVESESAGARLGDVAVRAGKLSRLALERARMLAHARGLRIGQALVASSVLSPSDLDELLALQRRARLEQLYALPDAEVRFRVARAMPPGASEQVPLSPRDTFHGRARKTQRPHGTRFAPPPRTSASSAQTAADVREEGLLAVLGLRPGATPAQLRAAYKKLVLDLHPDRAVHASDAERNARARRLVAVIEAYRALRG